MSLSEKDHPTAAGAAYLDNDPHRSSKSITNRLSAISDGLKKWRQGAVRGSLGGTGLGAIWFRHSGAGGGNGAGQRGAGPSVGSSASESDLSRHAYAPNINLNTGINPTNAPSPSNPSANNSNPSPNTTNPTAALAALTHRPSSAPTTSSLPSSSSSAQRARAARKGKMRQRASEAYAQFGPNSPAVAGSPADDDEDEEYGAVGLAYGGGYTGGGGGYGRGKDEEGQRRGKEQRTSWTPSFLLDLPLVGRRASRRESRRISGGGGDNGGQNRRQTQRRSFFAFFTPSPTRPSSQALSTPYQPPSQPQPQPPPPSQPQPQSQLQYTSPSPQPNLASAFNLSATSTDPTPRTPPPTLAPPSYAASLSQSNRDSDPPSSLIPSGPRSVSDVDADPTRFSGSGGGGGGGGAYGGAYAYSTSPYREDSYGYGSGTPQHAFLLHEGSPETGVSGGLSSIGAGSASAIGGGASGGASAGMGEAAEGEGEEDEASEDASIKGVVGTGIGVLVAGAGAGVVSSGSPGVRPLPDVVRYQQQQKQQQGQRKRMSIFSTSAPPLTPATPTPHNLQRKIIDPRLIDSPPTQHKTPQRQYNRASAIEPFSTSGTDADASIIEPHSMRAVLRSLSPRTSRLLPVPPPPPRQQHQHQHQHQQPHALAMSLPVAKEEEGEMESPQSTSSPTRRLLPPSPGGASGTEQESGWSWIVPTRRRISTASAGNAGVGSRGVKPLPRTPTSDEFGDGELVEARSSGVEGGADGVFLDVRETSPFRVDFGSVSRGTSVRALPPTTTRGTPLSEESAGASARRMERRSRGSRVSVGAGSAISANGSASGGSGSGGSGNASVKAPSGVSDDSFNSDPAYYTAGGSVNYKPARNTFGAASSSHDHGTLPTHVRKASSSESMTGGGGHSISGGMSSHPFRISDLVQGSSSRLPFRLTTISFQDAAQRAASTTAAAQPAAPAETSTAAAAQPTTNPPASGNPSPATSSEGVISFLDFTSSREGSLRVPSEKSLKQAANSKSKSKSKHNRQLPAPPPPIVVPELNSRWSNTTVPSIATTAPDAPGAAGSNAAAPVAGSSNQAQELQVESSDTGPVAGSSHQPQSHRSSSNTHSTDPVHVHPMLEDMESPTESLPMSTSEIRFRHSDSEEGHGAPAGLDDDISISISQPPTEGYSLSSAPPDMSNIPEEYRPRPFDPNVLVSRVLGLSSPTSSVTQRPLNHSRTQSNIAMSSATASVFHISSRHDSNYDLPSNLRSGQN